MKRMKFSILLAFLATVLFSCTTSKEPVSTSGNYPVSTSKNFRVVGVWKCIRIVPVGQPKPMDVLSEKYEEGVPLISPDVNELSTTYPGIMKTINIKGNKSAILVSGNSETNGTWALNQAARTLNITLANTNEVIQLTFNDFDQSYLSLNKTVENGEVIVYYHKEK